MARNITVFADSTCDLSKALCEEFKVGIIPLHINYDEQDYLDGITIKATELLEKMKKDNKLAKTSAVNIGEYTDFFLPEIEKGNDVIHISLGSGLSSAYQNACLAASEINEEHENGDFGKIYVIDSGSLSSGSGLLALSVSELAAQGRSAEEIVSLAEEIRPKCHASFVIDTLEYLYKGGRCSALSLFGANVLQIRPGIVVNPADGKMSVGKKYRGSIERCFLAYVKDQLEGRDDLDLSYIFITHSGISDECVENIKTEIKKYANFERIFICTAGCTISTHCGPGTMGVLFKTK